MKKIITLILVALMMMCTLTGCNNSGNNNNATPEKVAKIGIISVGDESEGYSFAHLSGIAEAAKELGISDRVIIRTNIPESEEVTAQAENLVEEGCTLIISNSYGHQSFMEKAAKAYPNVHFVADTGDTAAKSGLANFSNVFTKVYESRYVSGIVAGMKVKELVEAGKIKPENLDENGNVKIGYVGAYTYAEVVSGLTAFYLGIKSVYDKVAMQVTYTGSWFDITKEGAAAEKLMANGCVIIGQHADSTGAPAAVQAAHEKGAEVYSVGYNVDMLTAAPTAALTSATNNWGVYYKYAFNQWLKGEKIATDWAEGYETGAVAITKLGPSCAAGTQEAVDKAIADIKAGKLHVFDVTTFTVEGAQLTDATPNVKDGYYHESETISAPSFAFVIDGITNLDVVY
ncbi:MAG: BMP family ABC transporter substrate-binding protein [Erysipelotrichaceae bacterium]|nr:BMP family ABC transporter substrate-binding protein [Erysipelotrichaceae bacterium]